MTCSSFSMVSWRRHDSKTLEYVYNLKRKKKICLTKCLHLYLIQGTEWAYLYYWAVSGDLRICPAVAHCNALKIELFICQCLFIDRFQSLFPLHPVSQQPVSCSVLLYRTNLIKQLTKEPLSSSFSPLFGAVPALMSLIFFSHYFSLGNSICAQLKMFFLLADEREQ